MWTKFRTILKEHHLTDIGKKNWIPDTIIESPMPHSFEKGKITELFWTKHFRNIWKIVNAAWQWELILSLENVTFKLVYTTVSDWVSPGYNRAARFQTLPVTDLTERVQKHEAKVLGRISNQVTVIAKLKHQKSNTATNFHSDIFWRDSNPWSSLARVLPETGAVLTGSSIYHI